MLHRRKQKMIKCYEYATLSTALDVEEERWIVQSEASSIDLMNYNLIQALDQLSLEGWDLVCQGEDGYILRTQVEKQEPVPESE
jgi:hypothetical protein